jgi:aminoglycoside 6'-N-acetyltransferase I
MRIRPIEARDLAAWTNMRRDLWPDEDAAELAMEAQKFVRDGRALGLAAVLCFEDQNGALTGFVEIGLRDYVDGCDSSPVPFVEGWYVVPQARRTGVGRALIAAAESWSRERGYTEIGSDALLDNSVSEQAHNALGFEEVERAIRFRKDLSRKP